MSSSVIDWRPFCGNTQCPCMEPNYSGACEEWKQTGSNPRCGECGWPRQHHGKEREMSDRTVHGLTVRGEGEIVRYERAGSWYVEWPGSRQRITVQEAADLAAWGSPWLGLPGGRRFDSLVRDALSERSRG